MSSADKYPRGIEVCVGAIIRDGDKILWIRSPKWQNKLAFPGGHVEAGETIFAAAAREAKEETGLDVQPVAVTGFGEHFNPPQFHRPIHLIFFDVVCDAQSTELTLQADEATEAVWLTLEEIEKADIIDIDKEGIARYKQWLKTQ